MKPLDKYKIKKKLIEVGRLSWDLLIFFSKVTLFVFIMVTAFTFWMNVVVELYVNNQVDLSGQVSKMFLIVLMVTILIFIDVLKNLLSNKKKKW